MLKRMSRSVAFIICAMLFTGIFASTVLAGSSSGDSSGSSLGDTLSSLLDGMSSSSQNSDNEAGSSLNDLFSSLFDSYGGESAESYGEETITLAKVPCAFTVDLDRDNLFVNGLVDEELLSIERSGVDAETIKDIFEGPDIEALIFPAEYSFYDTPMYIYVFVTNGFMKQKSRLSKFGMDEIQDLFETLEGFYTDDEEPEFSAADIGSERYLLCDRVFINSSGKQQGYARDYYNIWNGDLIQVMVAYSQGYGDEAVDWAEDFLGTWVDAK